MVVGFRTQLDSEVNCDIYVYFVVFYIIEFLQGDHLDSGADQSDYNVTIGKEVCKVDSVSKKRLLCVPPREQPAGDPNSKNQLPLVKVS